MAVLVAEPLLLAVVPGMCPVDTKGLVAEASCSTMSDVAHLTAPTGQSFTLYRATRFRGGREGSPE